MTDTTKILKTAKERFTLANNEWSKFFQTSRKIISFINGEQWDPQLKNSREQAGLPCLTTNSIPTFLRHITNEARQQQPSIQIDPRDNAASKEAAETYADLIRGIEQQSQAEAAYDISGWYAAATGLGFIRIISEYEDDTSFDQKLLIKHVADPETILLDPNHKKIDGSDSEWAFVISLISKDDYERMFPNSKMALNAKTNGWSSDYTTWVREDQVLLAEYYWKEYTPATLYQVYNTLTQETIISTEKPLQELLDEGILEIMGTRPTSEVSVKWAKLNDIEILEQTDWPGTVIPIVAVKGDETWVQGKRKIKGAVEDAVDSQRALNYFFSIQAELVSLAPKAPYVGEIRQFKNFEHLWRDANISPTAFLPYNAVSEGGAVLPPPQRNTAEAPIQAAAAMCQQARDNLKAIFGIYDASLGAQGNETSGKAILTRTHQSHTTLYHFYDNLAKAVQQVGYLLVEAIPTYYSDVREVQLIKQNGQSDVKVINEDEVSRITDGKYGVVVETGPSYATRRQESVSAMITFGQAFPNSIPLIGDVIAEESDWPGAKKIAERLRYALPPTILEAEIQAGKGVSSEQQLQLAISQAQQVAQQFKELQMHTAEVEQQFKNAVDEIRMLKLKASIDIEKNNMDASIKKEQLEQDKVESEMSYKIKLAELELQKEQLALERERLALSAVEVASDINAEMHNAAKEHHKTIAQVKDVVKPARVSDNISDGHVEGIDTTFNTVSGHDIGNA